METRELSQLVGAAVEDAKKLALLEVQLFKVEMTERMDRITQTAMLFAAALCLAVPGLVLAALAAANEIAARTDLSTGASQALTGALCLVLALGCVWAVQALWRKRH